MEKKLTKIDREIIYSTECGPEELFVLIPGFSKEYGLDILLHSLVKLVNEGFLTYDYKDQRDLTSITLEELNKYVQIRLDAGESLDEYPGVTEEYRFTATDKGRKLLLDEDKSK